jgi:hypothetical protein
MQKPNIQEMLGFAIAQPNLQSNYGCLSELDIKRSFHEGDRLVYLNPRRRIKFGVVPIAILARKAMNSDSSVDEVQEPILTAPPEVRQIIERVWQVEKSRLDKKSFSHINDDILRIVKEVIQ